MSSLDRKVDNLAPYALGAFRIVVGALFASHGAASLFGVFGEAPATGGTVAFGTWPSWWAAVIQLVCGLLVAVGAFQRPAAVIASGSMAYAYFVVHQPDGLLPLQNQGEQAALFAWSFLLLAFTGPGALALSRTRRRRKQPIAA